jgi:glutathione S-transferase
MYKLYGRRGTGSQIPEMLLEEIGLPYETVWVGTEPADIDAYASVNPTRKVPTLVLPDGLAIFESAAISIHLATAHPQARLAPMPGSPEYARFLQWTVFLSANAYDSVLRIYYPERYTAGGEAAAGDVKTRAVQDYTNAIALVAGSLAPFVLGDVLSTVDYYLHVIGGWHPEGRGVLHAKCPQLAKHAALMRERAAVRKVEGEHEV